MGNLGPYELNMNRRKWTVADLIVKLQEMDEDRIILLSSDSEGNSFRPLDDFWEGEGYTDEDVVNGVPVLIFYPS